MEGVKTWLCSQATDSSDTSIQTPISCYRKSLNSFDGYLEKRIKPAHIFCI
jgi:hypothetical protein